jgi:hypothetical protein
VPDDFDVGEAIIDLLVRTGWLAEQDSGEWRQIGRALRTMLEGSAAPR